MPPACSCIGAHRMASNGELLAVVNVLRHIHREGVRRAVTVVTDSAYTLIDQVADSNGMEAWRLLSTRYAKSSQQTAIITLVSIVNTKFEDRTFETTFAKWESQVTKFERAIKKELYDEIKVGLLIAGTTGKLHDHQ